MNFVDLKLNPAPSPPDWDNFEHSEFICAGCLKTLPSRNDELFFFPEVDYFFHRHPDRSFYRALLLKADGNVRIATGDSESENVLQLLSIYLDGTGGHKLRFKHLDEIHNASRKFFEAMRSQDRTIEQSTFYIGADGTFHFG